MTPDKREAEILRRIDLDRVGREKALDLLNKGFESCCEDRDRLKQEVRRLAGEVERLREAASKLCTSISDVTPEINRLCTLAELHGQGFRGRGYGIELEVLEAALAPASPPE